jgi:hypothetical protein
MERQRYDRSSKWLIEHHGDQILRLAGIDDVVAWKPLHAEVVQPRQLPDGLLEVQRKGEEKPDLFLIEVETYPDRSVDPQLMDDLMLVHQNRRVLPEVVVLVLCPKGNVQVEGRCELASRSGRTGLAAWIPLMQHASPPETLLQMCRTMIDEQADPAEHANLLAVSQVMSCLRYNEGWLMNFFGGKEAMIDSPVLNEFVSEQTAKVRRKDIVVVLEERFGSVPPEKALALNGVAEYEQLTILFKLAAACPDLDTFFANVPRADIPE